MVRALRFRAPALVVVRRDVHFAADDRLHAPRRGFVIKIRRREHVSVIGDRHRGHSPARRLRRQLTDFAGAIQERVIRVQMKVNKVRGGHA